MIRQSISHRSKAILGIASVVAIVSIYSILSYRQHVANPMDTTLPNWKQFGEGIYMIFEKGWIWADFAATYFRLFLGMLIGVLSALLIGILMGCYTPASAFFLPPITFFSKIPPTAMLAVYFVLFGMDLELYIAMIAFGIFPTMAMSIYSSVVKDVPDTSVYKAYTLGATNMEVVWNVVMRQIFPRLLQTIQLHIGPAMVFLIAAEWMMAEVGLGYRLRIQSRLLNMNIVYTYLILLGGTGFLIEYFITVFRRKTCKWFGE